MRFKLDQKRRKVEARGITSEEDWVSAIKGLSLTRGLKEKLEGRAATFVV